jgi:hypothetical protein
MEHPLLTAEKLKLEKTKNHLLYLSFFFKFYLIAWSIVTCYTIHKIPVSNTIVYTQTNKK